MKIGARPLSGVLFFKFRLYLTKKKQEQLSARPLSGVLFFK